MSAEAAALRQAIEGHDLEGAREGAARLVNALGRPGETLPDAEALGLLQALLARRWFDVADPLADAFTRNPGVALELQRRAAQVMLERGRHAAALKLLLGLRRQPLAPQAEVMGHIARIHKQQFIDSVELGEPDPTQLLRATRTYLAAYDEAPAERGWHGVNAAALLHRCADFPAACDLGGRRPEPIAQAILQALQARPAGQLAHWDLATGAEAALALGDLAGAADWLRRYVARPDADAFALGATLRQFEEIWRLGARPEPEALGLRDLLRAALLKLHGGAVSVSREDVLRARALPGGAYEAVFGNDQFQSLENYRRGLERCACVARIGRDAEMGVGSGFLLDAQALGLTRVQGPVLVTNAHVLSADEEERRQGSLHPAEAVITFAALPDLPPGQEFAVAQVLYSSPRTLLDVTIVQLSPAPPLPRPIPLAPVLPMRGSKARVRVIGHPGGRGLSFSVNELLDHEDPRVHYRTATEGGSSGSPAFNDDWKLIALHHAGGMALQMLNGQAGSYQANEGIWIDAIRRAVAAAGG